MKKETSNKKKLEDLEMCFHVGPKKANKIKRGKEWR